MGRVGVPLAGRETSQDCPSGPRGGGSCSPWPLLTVRLLCFQQENSGSRNVILWPPNPEAVQVPRDVLCCSAPFLTSRPLHTWRVACSFKFWGLLRLLPLPPFIYLKGAVKHSRICNLCLDLLKTTFWGACPRAGTAALLPDAQ